MKTAKAEEIQMEEKDVVFVETPVHGLAGLHTITVKGRMFIKAVDVIRVLKPHADTSVPGSDMRILKCRYAGIDTRTPLMTVEGFYYVLASSPTDAGMHLRGWLARVALPQLCRIGATVMSTLVPSNAKGLTVPQQLRAAADAYEALEQVEAMNKAAA